MIAVIAWKATVQIRLSVKVLKTIISFVPYSRHTFCTGEHVETDYRIISSIRLIGFEHLLRKMLLSNNMIAVAS